MAALSSSRLYDLIERFFYARGNAPHAVFEIERFRFAAIRRLVDENCQSRDNADVDWLQRKELRGSAPVIEMLEASGFRERPGTMHALFVDGRCGLIRSHLVGAAADLEHDRAVTGILDEASNCHAEGVILATNDPGGEVSRAPGLGKLTIELCRKGEAIGIVLLDHVVLTSRGWNRLFPFGRNDGG